MNDGSENQARQQNRAHGFTAPAMTSSSGHDSDYSTEPVPEGARRPYSGIFFATVGVATALFYMQVTSLITLRYGSSVALIAILYATVASTLVGFGICHVAISTGFGTNLLARVVLGYRGASLFSLLFAVNTIVYFSVEATIMGASLAKVFPAVPMYVLMPAITMAMVPLVWYGMRALERVQFTTLLIYAVLLTVALIISSRDVGEANWATYLPIGAPPRLQSILASLSVMNGAVFITGLVTADFARYVPRKHLQQGRLLIGVVFPTFCFGLSGLLGLWFSTHYLEQNPGLYFVTMLGGWGTAFAIVTQLRINLANMYLGSIAILNFFEQMFSVAAKRWLVVLMFGLLVSGALLLHMVHYLTSILNVIGMFTLCFTSLVLTDLILVRRMDWESGALGHRRHAIENWRVPAIVSTLISTAIGCVLSTAVGGELLQSGASFIAGFLQVGLYWTLMRPRTLSVDLPSRASESVSDL